MSQGVWGFKYEEEKQDTGMTGLAGLPVYLDLMKAVGLPELIGVYLQVKQRGWTDAQMVLHTEFRDGNVPAGHEQLRVLKESLAMLPQGVEEVRLRSDTAGYQHSLLRYCEEGEDSRFGRIAFAIGADVTPEFKKAVLTEAGDQDWKPIYKEFGGNRIKTNQEWSEEIGESGDSLT